MTCQSADTRFVFNCVFVASNALITTVRNTRLLNEARLWWFVMLSAHLASSRPFLFFLLCSADTLVHVSSARQACLWATFSSILKPIGLLICFLNKRQMLFLPGYGTIQVSSGSFNRRRLRGQ
jgi:hypothetical protein